MPDKALRFCAHPGCVVLVQTRYCELHAPIHEAERAQKKREWAAKSEEHRASAFARGYDHRWSRYSKWYLAQPGHQLCVLHLDDGCAGVAQCVDHIRPHNGQRDPLFWASSNHQSACLHCNSVKGRRTIIGGHRYGR